MILVWRLLRGPHCRAIHVNQLNQFASGNHPTLQHPLDPEWTLRGDGKSQLTPLLIP